LFRHGQFLVSTGRVDAGYGQQAKAFELDPLDPMFAAFHGYNVWSKRDKAEGRNILEEAAVRFPDNVFVWFMRLNTAALDGDFVVAEALRADGKRLIPNLAESASYKAGERMQQLMMAPSPEAHTPCPLRVDTRQHCLAFTVHISFAQMHAVLAIWMTVLHRIAPTTRLRF
ncbi:MAG: hypothetical protein HC869_13980, partial [Rhodospirillales bacterium]|nr:hypothetical protein [Rhodospirillales bacterium]